MANKWIKSNFWWTLVSMRNQYAKVSQRNTFSGSKRFPANVPKYRKQLIRVSNIKEGKLFPDFVIGLHGIDDMARWEVFRDKKNA